MTRFPVAVVFSLAMAALTFAQQGQAPVPPDPTANAPAQTTPPTFPEGQTTKPSTNSHPEGRTATSGSSTKAGKTNVFRGMVVSQDGAFVLKAGDLVYRLDDQEQAKTYEGQKVRIDGTLDKQSNTIRMQSIGTQSE
jgi:uncharacterized protein YdeI (BOF family)